MTVFVVDTNVAIVANGGNRTDANEKCQQTCVKMLEQLVEQETVAIDEKGLILEEYANNLSWTGAPGVGDMFFTYLFNYSYQEDRILRVPITPSEDHRKGFEELPDNKFDPSDRKFLAVAAEANAMILNATDSDWSEHPRLLRDLGVEVDELCPHELRQNRDRRR